MTNENSWVWQTLEGLVDLQDQLSDAQAEVDRLQDRIDNETSRIIAHGAVGADTIAGTIRMIRAIGSPLDVANPREPEAVAPKADPLDIPPHLDRRAPAEAAE